MQMSNDIQYGFDHDDIRLYYCERMVVNSEIARLVKELMTKGSVEVGWRSSCGKTDNTNYVYREWVKIVNCLRKDGFEIKEERQKHNNSYATVSGGFWNSIVYSLVK